MPDDPTKASPTRRAALAGLFALLLPRSKPALAAKVTLVNGVPLVFLSAELQPLGLCAIGRASLLRQGWVVAAEAFPAPVLPARALAVALSDRPERDE